MTSVEDGTLRVLVVDDDPDIRIMCHTLTISGRYRYDVSSTAEGGLDELRRSADSFDLVLVDFALDEAWSAVTFIEHAKQIRPDLPYFIWSSYSNEDIRNELQRLTLSQILGLNAAGFVEKRSISRNPDSLNEIIAHGLDEFRQQVAGQLQSTLLDTFKELDVALAQTRAASRAMADIESSQTPGLRKGIKPLRLRLNRVEATLQHLLGYRDVKHSNWRSGASDALDEIVSSKASRHLPHSIRASLAQLATEDDRKCRSKTHERLRAALEEQVDSEQMQGRIAEHVSQLVEFMIYAGRPHRAADVSGEIWRCANKKWSFVPKMSCAVTHSLALASSGDLELAEQLTAAMLLEAEPLLSDSDLKEVTRSVFAELDDFAKLAIA